MTDTLHSSLSDIYNQFGHTENLKGFLYGWEGANEWLFRLVNSIHNPWYDYVMSLLSAIAQHRNFPYYFGALFLYVILNLLMKSVKKRGGKKQYLIQWLGIFSVLLIGYAADGIMIKSLKNEFHYPRPYVALAGVTELSPQLPPELDYESFPSGHIAFITMLIISLWPAFGTFGRIVGMLLIAGVAWSRVAMGQHFPADVAGGFFFTLILMLILQTIIYKIYQHFFGFKC